MATQLRKKANKFMKHSNWVPWVTQAAVLQVDYLHLCPLKKSWYDFRDEKFQK